MSNPSPFCTEQARIGPNAAIQLAEALRAGGAEPLARAVFAAAGRLEWLDAPPRDMIGEDDAARLHAALAQLSGPDGFRVHAREAGRLTGRYILANRIPGPARTVLVRAPAWLAARLLVRAIAAHAWTFAGSGSFHVVGRRPLTVAISANPLAVAGREAGGCEWHAAVFRELFRSLVHPEADARETECCRDGAPGCLFEIDWPSGRGGALAAPA